MEPEIVRAMIMRRLPFFTYCDSAGFDIPPTMASKGHDCGARYVSDDLSFLPESSRQLLASVVAESSVDHPDQSGDCTIDNNPDTFWSSFGSDETTTEHITYALSAPSAVTHIGLEVYRAEYQAGSPVYPPMAVQVDVGFSPETLQPASEIFWVAPSDVPLIFPLQSATPVGSYLRINFIGKLQRQLEDHAFYHAIRSVSAWGEHLPPSVLVQLIGAGRVPVPSPAESVVNMRSMLAGCRQPADESVFRLDSMLPARESGQPFALPHNGALFQRRAPPA